jgi:hypothetical protein
VIALLWLVGAALAGTARLGLFVGNNVGMGQDEPLVYAESEARNMARIFQEMGDLQRERTTVLQGASAAQLAEAIQRVDGQVREVEARGDDALLVFYYSGHASRQGLHMSGSIFGMDEVQRWLEHSAADVRVAFVDACESGGLARIRGGSPVEHVEVHVEEALTSSGLAIMTSTGPLSVARESAAYGGGVFSRALLTGLRGGADLDADGQITLDEAYRHAFEQTVASTARSGSGIQRPEYRYEIAGMGQVVLTRVPHRAAGLTLPEELEGVYTVVSVGTGQVVARVDKVPGESQRLSLPAGRYVVRKVRREDVLLAELDLVWGGDRWVDDQAMSSVPLGDALARGGWRPRPIRISARGVGNTARVRGNPMGLGGELAFHGRVRPQLTLGVHGGFTTGRRVEWTGRMVADSAYAGLGLFAERHLGRVDLWVGGGPSVTRAGQRVMALELADEDIDTEVHHAVQWIGGGFVSGGAHVPVGPGFGVELGLRAQVQQGIVDHAPRLLLEGAGTFGVSISVRTRKIAQAKKG